MRLTILNESRRPDADVVELVEFAAAPLALRVLEPVAVLVKDVRSSRNGFTGWAYDGIPRWAERAAGRRRPRFAISIRVATNSWNGYGHPRVCWHATAAKRTYRADPDLLEGARQLWVEDLAAAGAARYGRWPIYHVDDWREGLLRLAAHELFHIAQYANGSRRSEVECENYASRRLATYREET